MGNSEKNLKDEKLKIVNFRIDIKVKEDLQKKFLEKIKTDGIGSKSSFLRRLIIAYLEDDERINEILKDTSIIGQSFMIDKIDN